MDWEQFGQRMADMGRDVTEMVKEKTDVLKLKQKISAEKRKQKDAFAEIGKLYFEENEGEVGSEFIPLFAQVNASIAAIAELEEQLKQDK